MPSRRRSARRRPVVPALLAAALVLVLLGTLGVVVRQVSAERGSSLAVSVVSGRADSVTGGSARVAVTVPEGVDPSAVRLRVNGVDQTGRLRPGPDGRLAGVVDGLGNGFNDVAVTAPGTQPASTVVRNRPAEGPLFAGARESPFACRTGDFVTASRVPLGKPLDDSCSVRPRTDYLYFSRADRRFKPLIEPALSDPSQRPNDVDTVRTDSGRTVPFVVGVQVRTVNRGVSQVAMLSDPAAPVAERFGEWNAKLAYVFGGGCAGGWYTQGTVTGNVLSPSLLGRGFAVASNSLNVFGQNCSDLLAAETMAMTKEQFVKDHGVPLYTMGLGCSGGAYQTYQIADNYPGLLDGIVAGCSLADVGFDAGLKFFDSRLLDAYARRYPNRLSPAQLRAVSGFSSTEAVAAMSRQAVVMDPQGRFPEGLAKGERYDPRSNPEGARATIWDHTVNVYGRDPETGFARRPIGNAGVQYGLGALLDNRISFDQFVDLNARIGGLDADLRPVPDRSVANPDAVRAAYATGRLLDGGQGLRDTPIIDYRAYRDGPRSTDLHMRYHSFVIRERLARAAGDARHQVQLVETNRSGFDLERGVLRDAVAGMDRWLTTLRTSGRTGRLAMLAAKPADLVDACWTPDGRKLAEPQTYTGSGTCNRLYRAYAAPRLVAGGPLAGDVLSCLRVPVDPTAYGRRLTPAQARRLEEAFPDGVCDWDRPGRNRSLHKGPWQSFS